MTPSVEQRSYRLDAVSMLNAALPSVASTTERPVLVALRGRTRLLLEALLTRLDKEAGLRTCGLVTDPDAGPLPDSEMVPDIVIREMQPQESPADIVPHIQSRFPGSRVVLLCSNHQHAESAAQATEYCVSVKDSLDHCLTVVRRAAGQDADPDHSAGDEKPASSEQLVKSLTPRQLEIFSLLARGDSVKEVARALEMSFKAIDSQKYRIMRKLGITDRVQATRLAIRAGLLNP